MMHQPAQAIVVQVAMEEIHGENTNVKAAGKLLTIGRQEKRHAQPPIQLMKITVQPEINIIQTTSL